MIVMAKRTLLTPTIEGERRAVAVEIVTVMTLANSGMEAAQESEARGNQSRVIEEREIVQELHLTFTLTGSWIEEANKARLQRYLLV